MTKPNDSTVARIAGNIMAGLAPDIWAHRDDHDLVRLEAIAVRLTVRLARAIVKEVERTTPPVEAAP